MKDKRLPYIIASVILVIILGCAFVFIHLPINQKMQVKRTEYEQKKAQLDLVQKKVKELMKLKNDMQKLEDEKMVLDAKIPQQMEVPDMVSLLEQLADENGVIVSSVTFQGSPEASTTVPGISINSSAIKLKGSYSSIVQYFDSMKKAPRLIGIKTINIAPTEEDGKTLNIDMMINYFNYASTATATTTTTGTATPTPSTN